MDLYDKIVKIIAMLINIIAVLGLLYLVCSII